MTMYNDSAATVPLRVPLGAVGAALSGLLLISACGGSSTVASKPAPAGYAGLNKTQKEAIGSDIVAASSEDISGSKVNRQASNGVAFPGVSRSPTDGKVAGASVSADGKGILSAKFDGFAFSEDADNATRFYSNGGTVGKRLTAALPDTTTTDTGIDEVTSGTVHADVMATGNEEYKEWVTYGVAVFVPDTATDKYEVVAFSNGFDKYDRDIDSSDTVEAVYSGRSVGAMYDKDAMTLKRLEGDLTLRANFSQTLVGVTGLIDDLTLDGASISPYARITMFSTAFDGDQFNGSLLADGIVTETMTGKFEGNFYSKDNTKQPMYVSGTYGAQTFDQSKALIGGFGGMK